MIFTSMLIGLASMAAQDPPADSPQPVPQASAALTAMFPELAAEPGVIIVGYPVRGGTPRSVRESMNDVRPATPSGERFDGMTSWRFATRWQGTADGNCDPSTAEVTMTIVVTLPELEAPQRLNRQERANWERYLKALAGHEHNHVRLAVAGGEQLRTFMRGAPNCATMQAARAQIDAAIRDANNTYDTTTRHGATEGARYP